MNVEDERRDKLRQQFKRVRGYWSPLWEAILSMDLDFLEAYLNFSAVPWEIGTLEPKVREFIYIAINISTTHLYEPGLRGHLRNALGYGATREEVFEVFALASVIGIHTISLGFPVLFEEAGKLGKPLPSGPLDERQAALKNDFINTHGYWDDFREQFLTLDAPLFETYEEFARMPWRKGTLEPKVKEFICIAVDAAVTHMFEPGAREHIRKAFAHGATVAEIVEVLELTSVIGIHTCTMGVPILIDELARFEARKTKATGGTGG